MHRIDVETLTSVSRTRCVLPQATCLFVFLFFSAVFMYFRLLKCPYVLLANFLHYGYTFCLSRRLSVRCWCELTRSVCALLSRFLSPPFGLCIVYLLGSLASFVLIFVVRCVFCFCS